MGNNIVVPGWAAALFQVLDPATDKRPITPKVKQGKIGPGTSLLYDLGIGPQKLQNMVDQINRVIERFRSLDSDGGLLDIDTLAGVKTIGELANDVHRHLGSV